LEKRRGFADVRKTGLRANPRVRVIVNQNDFLLTDDDLGVAPGDVHRGAIDGV